MQLSTENVLTVERPRPESDEQPMEETLARARETIAEARAESHRALARLASALGYPEEWAELLERRSFARGKLWRRA